MENRDFWIKGISFQILAFSLCAVFLKPEPQSWRGSVLVCVGGWNTDVKQLSCGACQGREVRERLSPPTPQLICTPGQPCSCSLGTQPSYRLPSRSSVASTREDRGLPRAFGFRPSQSAAVEHSATPVLFACLSSECKDLAQWLQNRNMLGVLWGKDFTSCPHPVNKDGLY